MSETPESAFSGNYVQFNARLRPSVVEALDTEAHEIGISRMALIQVILHNHVKAQEMTRTLYKAGEGNIP